MYNNKDFMEDLKECWWVTRELSGIIQIFQGVSKCWVNVLGEISCLQYK